MKPVKKSTKVRNMMNNIMGIDTVETIKQDICVSCKKPATEFRDQLSRKEFSISGFCQTCQDSVFGGPE